MLQDESAQVSQRATLANKVVDKQKFFSGTKFPFEDCRARHPLPARCTGVVHYVCLNDARFNFEVKSL